MYRWFCFVAALWLSGAQARGAQCPSAKNIDWVKTLLDDPKTTDLAYVAGLNAIAVGQVGSATLALIPLSFNASSGVESLLIYRLTTAKPCTTPTPNLLGSFKTDTTLVTLYFNHATLHLVTLANEKERSSQHPSDFWDTGYVLEGGKLVKVSNKEVKSAKQP